MEVSILCIPTNIGYYVYPTIRVFLLEKVAQNLSLTLAKVINDTILALEGIQEKLQFIGQGCYGR